MIVNIETDGKSSSHTKITDGDGNAIRGIKAVRLEIGDRVLCQLTLCDTVRWTGPATFCVSDPRHGGKLKDIAKIVFADGTEFDAKVARLGGESV